MKIEVDIEDSKLDRIIVNDLNMQLAGAASEGNEKMADAFRSVIEYYGGTPIPVVIHHWDDTWVDGLVITCDGEEIASL